MNRARRWPANLLLSLANTALLRFAFPLLAVGAALWAEETGIGLFNMLPVPSWLTGLAAFAALDLFVYAQHVVMHRVGLLWRVHRVHHADRDVDVTTALRFHPLEIALSMGLKMAAVVALGAPAWAVALFEVALNATAMFNHANLRLSQKLDTRLRSFVVTPDMHRIHHSVAAGELNSNFGFNFSFWDRVFGTYREAPALGHEGMTLGLKEFQTDAPASLGFALALPFRRLGA